MTLYDARQSTYVNGETITAAHSNDEFDRILAAFHVTTGHKHDGSTTGDGSKLVVVGALDSGSITSGFGTIDTGSSTITTTGAISGGGLTITGAIIKSVGNTITAGSTQTQAGATALTKDINRITVSGTDGDGVKLPAAVAGAKVEIINDDSAETIKIWPATGDAIDGGSANAVDANTLAAGSDRTYFSVDATNWYTKSSDELVASATVAGIVELATTAEVNTGSDSTRAITPAGLTAWTGDTALVTVGTIGTGTWQGTAIDQTYLTGQSGTNTGDEVVASLTDSGTIEIATTAEVNTGTDDTRAVSPAGLTAWTGDTGIITTGALNAGSIASGFGAIDNGASAITTTGVITGGNVVADDIDLNGKVIVMTGDTNDTVTMTAAANGAFSLVTVDTAAAAGNIQITADGTVDIDSAGVLTLDSGAAINIEPHDGSAILLDGTISVDAGVVTGATSITSTAFVGDVTGNVSGTAATALILVMRQSQTPPLRARSN